PARNGASLRTHSRADGASASVGDKAASAAVNTAYSFLISLRTRCVEIVEGKCNAKEAEKVTLAYTPPSALRCNRTWRCVAIYENFFSKDDKNVSLAYAR